jgi:hypothetical protein|tara:strand:- start:146 stop:307 length:162 start_codon:yes stop_codon:yes gene_type:complete
MPHKTKRVKKFKKSNPFYPRREAQKEPQIITLNAGLNTTIINALIAMPCAKRE